MKDKKQNGNQLFINILYTGTLKKWLYTLLWITVTIMIFVIYLQIQNRFWKIFNDNFILFLQTPKHILAFICAALLARFLLTPRYIIIDLDQGIFQYCYPFLKKKFYFAEVETIQVESDMSQALLKLKSKINNNIYLKLRNKKLLFVGAFDNFEKSAALIHELKSIFDVEIEKLHKVGRKRGEEVTLGRYTVEKEISHGGMGKVFLAKDKFTHRTVAIKVLPANLALNRNNTKSFAYETKILQRLTHPNIIRILNVGREKEKKSDVYFYAMECIDGKPLSHYIKNQIITMEQSVRYTIQIALALDYIHKHKVVHRDIKPENIMVRYEGSCVLIDFGIARDVSIRKIKTRKRVFHHQPEISHYMGTLPYMSPEQISSKTFIDYRTDLYSLGITLYEMLIHERVYDGNSQTIIFSILYRTPSPPSSKNSNIPKELDTIIMKAIAKDKYERYKSGADMAEDLHRWLHGIPLSTRRVSLFWRIWQKIFAKKIES